MRSIGVLLVFLGGFVIYLVAKGKGPDAMNALLGITPSVKDYGGVVPRETFNEAKPGYWGSFFKKNADGSWRFFNQPESNYT